jgi:hypothetical protein
MFNVVYITAIKCYKGGVTYDESTGKHVGKMVPYALADCGVYGMEQCMKMECKRGH